MVAKESASGLSIIINLHFHNLFVFFLFQFMIITVVNLFIWFQALCQRINSWIQEVNIRNPLFFFFFFCTGYVLILVKINFFWRDFCIDLFCLPSFCDLGLIEYVFWYYYVHHFLNWGLFILDELISFLSWGFIIVLLCCTISWTLMSVFAKISWLLILNDGNDNELLISTPSDFVPFVFTLNPMY